ncbi:hypothetical protein TAMC210_03090 [Thermanaeromonas sp. C210]|nr:hypothetical protein TAMC210_03090 [Thermanaeromonas sp. C210]
MKTVGPLEIGGQTKAAAKVRSETPGGKMEAEG